MQQFLSAIGLWYNGSNHLYSVIYFHNPKKVRADEWMFAEMESPWSGDGRGVVTQRIFSKDGTLLATCHQEVKSLV